MKSIRTARLIRSQSGFTLVEIIVVLIIISIIMGFLVSGIFKSATTAKLQISEMKLEKLKSGINNYQLANNRLPSTLQALVSCEQNTGRACVVVAEKEDLNDGFGTPIQFIPDGSGRSYQLKCLGADGKEGGSGTDSDIVKTGP